MSQTISTETELALIVNQALYDADPADISAELDEGPTRRVGSVTVGTQGAYVGIKDDGGTTINGALGGLGLECSSIRLTWDGLEINVWQREGE